MFFSRYLPALLPLATSALLSGCGLYVPEKDPVKGDARTAAGGSIQGNYENDLIDHITCELAQGLQEASRFKGMPWFFDKWGFTITLSTTAEDQSGLSPGATLISPLRNVVFPFANGPVTAAQSFSFSLGGSVSVNALRTETIEYTYRNRDVVRFPCDRTPDGVLMDGDLKLRDFVYDKAVIIAFRNYIGERADAKRPAFNGWTEEVTFVSAYGGSITPTWKLARVSSGASSNLLVAQRTNITFGPVDPIADSNPLIALSLTKDAMAQHYARVQASAIAVSASGQTH